MSANKQNPLDIKYLYTPILTMYSMQGLQIGSPANTSNNTLDSYTFDSNLLVNQGTELIIQSSYSFAAVLGTKTPNIVYDGTTVLTVGSTFNGVKFYSEIRIRNMDDSTLLYTNFYIVGSNSFGSTQGTITHTPGNITISAKAQSTSGGASDLLLNTFSVRLANYGGF